MAALGTYVNVIWALNASMQVLLLLFLAARKHYRQYPVFFLYVCSTLFQGSTLLAIYGQWGFSSRLAQQLAWSTQAFVVCARALAVSEVCRVLLAPFRGIWALAWRILAFLTASVIAYPMLRNGWRGSWTILQIELGLESTMMVAIVALFVFARYYEVVANDRLRALGIGFFLLSSFTVVNDTILQRMLDQYVDLWRVLGMLSFLASLTVWVAAFHKRTVAANIPRTPLLPPDIYHSVAPKVNERLRDLNEQLGRFWRVAAHGS